MPIAIEKWAQLAADRSWNSLLLGNGASIALHPGFGYSSLFQVAQGRGTLRTSSPVFASLTTNDFEAVLLALWHADIVNNALGAGSTIISQAYADVRDALIDAVHDVHCAPGVVAPSFPYVTNFAKAFQTIVTFNYDLTLYWAMLDANQSLGTWFKDCFMADQTFNPNWKGWRGAFNAAGSTLVFFGHGSLILGRDVLGREAKLVNRQPAPGASPTLLLNTVVQQWRSGSVSPVFVSEGTSAEKLRSIRRSGYLSTVYDQVLTDLGDAVVAYGLSFAANDRHILDAMKAKPPRELAVSVFTGAPPDHQQAFCHRVLSDVAAALGNATTVRFFDHSSPGCWNNP